MAGKSLESRTSTSDTIIGSGLLTRISKRVSTGLSGIFRKKPDEKQMFYDSVRAKYKISEAKFQKLSEVIEYQYGINRAGKSRADILREEEQYSREYTEFLSLLKTSPDNILGKLINEEVTRLYQANNGKVSTARIFAELKKRRAFNSGIRYNSELNRYEVYANNNSEDIRKVPVHKKRQAFAFKREGSSYMEYQRGEIDDKTKHRVKRDIIVGLDLNINLYAQELKNLGFRINYQGVDDILEERYDVSSAYAFLSKNPDFKKRLSVPANSEKRLESQGFYEQYEYKLTAVD